MALNDQQFITEVVELQDEMIQSSNYDEAKEVYASKLAAAISKYIKSGTVTVNVTTTGSATNQAGTGTGKIE
ncbi:hypothetical protein [Flavobacterium sp. B183]|uniref:hypothetical protein n=1 Tax=Flavobacterium sp. B183 TaxID=907046 RepID=UPI00201E95EB|nr:hypothetical protein [Flavobacterium sp. B183]URC13942.1 hypothetical protein M4I44_05970 [Flavobacterium sp. B183]URC14036.1 hypothetical protein M4I44_06510 [Flavobacterium sp. B183]